MKDFFIIGKSTQIRTIRTEDAEFVLSLRCDPLKAKFLNHTIFDIEKQKQYIAECHKKLNEYYFIIENINSQAIGTYRIYDLKEESFCIGSWLMIDGVTPFEVMEADYLVRKFGFEELGFEKCHFDVRKNNKKVISYHKMMGAVQIDENDLDYFFECTKSDYYERISKFLFEQTKL